MAVAIKNAHEDGLEFHFTPDGQSRTATRMVVIDEPPLDPETQQPMNVIHLGADAFGFSYIEGAEIEGDGAEWDDASASVRVGEPGVELTGKWLIKAIGPPEFQNKNRD